MSISSTILPIEGPKKIILLTEKIKGTKITEENGVQKKEIFDINAGHIKVNEIVISKKRENNIILDEKKLYEKSIIEKEDRCEKWPLRLLVFIPLCIFYFLLSFFDLITYLIVPIFNCLFYTLSFLCNSLINIITAYQIEEEIGFSGAFTLENDIKIEINSKGGVLHLNEIICFSYLNACTKRYCCFLCVLVNHIVVPILQSWNRSKKCFIPSEIEEQYEERELHAREASSYKGYETIPTQVEIINI